MDENENKNNEENYDIEEYLNLEYLDEYLHDEDELSYFKEIIIYYND